mmetsp:Transcript_18910/g.31277  ORF Transcript_18910/g.31277 Transcript_18910/m.31277 type:complete len:811 (+) Transcript_18910:114-2546(+)|eukprot:CAMPEP_0119016170 /NCGR_PEP_ID=MMETSP1176-20130426/11849_1 /TAXON_ID=265551 /ORGANISM="Synedropsis recta cf, Strain CCMP1620" /LENGTH=810 /DNA_ID=CAMNT_0006969503 /DNA_START=116 /DNA_END=2545 /DNA_ORIENTATION=-
MLLEESPPAPLAAPLAVAEVAEHGHDDDELIYEVDDGEVTDAHFDPVIPGVMQSTPPMALMALKVTSQPWNILGHGSDPNVAASNDMTITVERITSLFLVRIAAIVTQRNALLEEPNPDIPQYPDSSTTNICTEALRLKKPWPKPITSTIIQQLRMFIRDILEKYNEVHYHSFEHAYHVIISCHKLMDMMLVTTACPSDVSAARSVSSSSDNSSGNGASKVAFLAEHRKTFGLKDDPLMTLALIFSALVHDVEHKGVPNRQLVLESDELAILYNDQSVAEQRSLAVAFSVLMQKEYEDLREVVFENKDEYRRFRKTVINLVLATDIASPERTQLVKSKWKEAFGETTESKERKKNKEMSRRSVFSNAAKGKQRSGSDRTSASLPGNWRGGARENSKPRAITATSRRRMQRRSSPNSLSVESTGVSSLSMMSELTIDPSIRHHPHHLETTNELNSTHDEESEENTSSSATPESRDGLEPSLPEEEEFDMGPSGALSAAPSAPPSVDLALANSLHTMTTPIISGKGQLSRSKKSGLDMDAVPPMPATSMMLSRSKKSGLGMDVALPMPGMMRRSTDSGISNSSFRSSSSKMETLEAAPPSEDSESSASKPCTGSKRNVFNRRFSSPDASKSYNVRLSIRRSLDLTGEAIENYSVSTRTVASSYQPNKKQNAVQDDDIQFDADDADEFKASVVMEHILRAADIGPNMQGFEQMEKWSGRLFYELKSVCDTGRGEDPQSNWFENQITFLESYILPLARRLDDMGVFGDSIGPMFATIVQQNKEKWVSEGLAATARVVQEWHMSKGEKHKLNSGW